MRLPTQALVPVLLLSLAGCSTVGDIPAERIGSSTITLSSGVPAGTAQVFTNGDQVSLAVAITGLSPGVHGIHLHTTGRCARPDFASAGGHLNPLGREHGSANPEGRHVGDLPNITIGASGTGSLTADLIGTREQVRDWLFDGDGTAIVVHADPDDNRTDPSGNSGSRIACGVIDPS